jgi:hypothetical protein
MAMEFLVSHVASKKFSRSLSQSTVHFVYTITTIKRAWHIMKTITMTKITGIAFNFLRAYIWKDLSKNKGFSFWHFHCYQ